MNIINFKDFIRHFINAQGVYWRGLDPGNSTSRDLRFETLHRKSHHHVDIVNHHVDIVNRHVDIVNRRVDIVNRRVDVVAWQSAHGATNRATVMQSCSSTIVLY